MVDKNTIVSKVSKEVRRGKIEYTPRVGKKNKTRYPLQTNLNPGQHTVYLKSCDNSIDISQVKVVIFCHLYYDDLIDEIFNYIKGIPCKVNELWFSLPCDDPITPDHKTVNKKNKILRHYPNANIRIVPNKGKDIGGKLLCLRDYLSSTESTNDWMIFCHDKKSPHIKGSGGIKWRRELLSSIFSPFNIQKALTVNASDKILMWGGRVREGLVDSRAIAVHPGNFNYMKKIIRFFGFKTLPQTSAFIGGTMFWVDENFYRKCFKNININSILELLELGDVTEPSYTHAIERMFGMLVTLNKGKIGII